ncbi:NAD(P)H-binding protein [Streptomyces sp. NPDC006875]|uniref:NmrA family NAD(P)-binding protein n=1 Tax=Streptomyces sp. NPDC006875 TaxID=3154781 RepID=UPI0033E9775B
MATILVTTANGDTGRPMVDHLVENGFPVRAMVRTDDERAQRLRYKGAAVVFGTLLDFRAVRAALKGLRRAYFTYPVGEGLVEAAVMFPDPAPWRPARTPSRVRSSTARRNWRQRSAESSVAAFPTSR